ncbi:MAG: outer membrane beta-barrel protein [Burkholderiaceae bacterium]
MKKLSQSIILCFVLALPATVGAQTLFSNADPVGLKLSVYWLPEVKPLESGATFSSAHTAQTNWRLGLALAPRWDVQIGLSPTGSQDRLARQRQALFGADALYMLGTSDLRPFVLLGLGAQRDARLDDAATRFSERTTPFINAGFGLQYRWSDTLGLQADIRRVQGFGRDPLSRVGLKGSENTLNFGMTWSFGRAN